MCYRCSLQKYPEGPLWMGRELQSDSSGVWSHDRTGQFSPGTQVSVLTMEKPGYLKLGCRGGWSPSRR